MAVADLSCTKGTFVSYVDPSNNHTSSTSSPVSLGLMFEECITNDAEEVARNSGYYANLEDLNVGAKHYDRGSTILEFDDPNGVLTGYHNVTALDLHGKIQISSGAQTPANEKYIHINQILVYAYISDKASEQITLNNFNENVQAKLVCNYTPSFSDQAEVTFTCSINTDTLRMFGSKPVRYAIFAGINYGTNGSPQDAYASATKTVTGDADDFIEKRIVIANTYLHVVYDSALKTPLSPRLTKPEDYTRFPYRAPITFEWEYRTETPATLVSTTIRYKQESALAWQEIQIADDSTSYTLNTPLVADTYMWEACITNSIGQTSSYSAFDMFITVDQLAPTASYPSSGLVFTEGQNVRLEWIYNSSTTAVQTSATINYRVNGGAWTSITSNSSEHYYILQGLGQGQYEWKVSITNNYGDTSADSDILTFSVVGKPQTPIISTPDNCCLTTISWNASGQESAEIVLYKGDDELLVHETIATAVTSYKPQMFLKGTYKAKVRIKNNSDLWSDFGELTFTIDAAGPTKGTLIATPLEDRVVLNGTHSSTNVALVRIEDGEETVIAMSDSAVDDTVAGNTVYTYVVRSWNTGGYTDSDIKVIECGFTGSIIKGDSGELHLDKSDTVYIPHEETFSGDYAALKFVGREYPIVETDNFTNSELAKRFHVTREQSKVLNKLAKEKSVFYRDNHGNAYKAKITGLKYQAYLDTGYLVEMSFIRTAPNEVIINV